MKNRPLAILCGAFLAAPHVQAQGLNIEHQPIGCLVADNYPELTACFHPSTDVARARLQFRATGTVPWYFVEMQAGGACHTAILPRPKASTKGIDYYIDVASKSYGESRTPDYAPRIASGLAGCKRRGLVAGFVTTAAVRVFVPAGAPAIPAGFSGVGVTSTLAATGPGAGGANASASGSGGGAEPDKTSAAKKGPADKSAKAKSGGGGGGGGGAGVVLGVLALGAAGGAVYYTTQKKDPAETDDDGDGVSEKDGDCDDGNRDVTPNGGFSFTVDFAWTGSNSCSALNTRPQTYRVQNKSCTPLALQGLSLVRAGSGPICPPGASSEKVGLSTNTVAPGATSVVRTGAAAGSAGSVCCDLQSGASTGRCPTGSCTVSETYTLATSAGQATVTNSFMVNTTTGCPVCGTPNINDWPLANVAPSSPDPRFSRWSPWSCE